MKVLRIAHFLLLRNDPSNGRVEFTVYRFNRLRASRGAKLALAVVHSKHTLCIKGKSH
jgi:hypothetical protein